uniref:Uncharacterized protein n=1 Tax=Aegilops tauschii subsp. strangulata TaxID=200361 RepID=A0A453B984_AEGTS
MRKNGCSFIGQHMDLLALWNPLLISLFQVFLCITMRNLLSLYGSSFLQMVDQSMCTEDTCARFSRSIKQKLIES